jgi:hypothetical protein
MTRTTTFAASLATTIVACSVTALAQTAPIFEKKNYNYSEWARVLNIVQLAWPGMMVEVDVTAMAPLR